MATRRPTRRQPALALPHPSTEAEALSLVRAYGERGWMENRPSVEDHIARAVALGLARTWEVLAGAFGQPLSAHARLSARAWATDDLLAWALDRVSCRIPRHDGVDSWSAAAFPGEILAARVRFASQAQRVAA